MMLFQDYKTVKKRGGKKNYLSDFVSSIWNPLLSFLFFSLHFLNTTPFFPPFDETDIPILTSLSQFGSCYMPSGNLAQDLCTISCTFSHKSCKSNNNASCRMKW